MLSRRTAAVIGIVGLLLPLTSSFAQSPACRIDKETVAAALGVKPLAGYLSLEAATCDAITLGDDSIGFRLDKNSKKAYNGMRSEVAINFPFRQGDTVRYSWEMKFPAEFESDTPLNRWWLVAQWHDQPDKRLNQSWADVVPGPPPVSLYLDERDGVLGLGIRSGGENKRSWAELPRGEWLKMSVTIHWSRERDGEVALAVAGHPEFSSLVKGPNMRNDYQHYLKFGQYRHPGITSSGEVTFRRVSITKL